MLINTGVVYKFEFITEFKEFNNVYLVSRILTYQETLDDNIDLFKEVYEKVGLTQTRYDEDSFNFRTDRILKLTKKNTTEDILHIPFSLCKIAPDPNVKKYLKLVIDLNLGIFDDADKLQYVADIMKEHIESATGITTSPELTKYGEEWLSETEYQVIEDQRDDTLKKIINFFTQVNQLQKDNDHLKNMVNYYEEKFLQLTP